MPMTAFILLARSGLVAVIAGPRIGITRAAELPLRYGLAGSAYLSRPFKPTSSPVD
jgi:DNA-3-methyladenine glycosylase